MKWDQSPRTAIRKLHCITHPLLTTIKKVRPLLFDFRLPFFVPHQCDNIISPSITTISSQINGSFWDLNIYLFEY